MEAGLKAKDQRMSGIECLGLYKNNVFKIQENQSPKEVLSLLPTFQLSYQEVFKR